MRCPARDTSVSEDASVCGECGADLEAARRAAVRTRMRARADRADRADGGEDAVDRFVNSAILVERPARCLERERDD